MNFIHKPAGFLLSRRRPQICGLAEFKPKLLLSRPEIYSKPAWGSKDKDKDLLDLTPEDKDKDLTPKDQDKDKDLKYVLKESLRTRTRTRTTARQIIVIAHINLGTFTFERLISFIA